MKDPGDACKRPGAVTVIPSKGTTMNIDPTQQHEPRERAVACDRCPLEPTPTMTWNVNGICDRHASPLPRTRLDFRTRW